MTENLPMTFINLFFVPLVSMMVYHQREKKEYIINVQFFLKYVRYCIAIPIISKIPLVLIRKIFLVNVGTDGAIYMLIATVVAFLLPYCVEWWNKNIQIRCEITAEKERNTDE